MEWHGTKLYGWSESEALTLCITKLVPEDLQTIELNFIKQLSQKEILDTYQIKRRTKNGPVINVRLMAAGLINHAKKMYAIVATEQHNKLNQHKLIQNKHGNLRYE
jgi:two-component system CheB/CheR fusion protein